MALFHRKLKCDFCGKPLDEENFYEWHDKLFCSHQCKHEYRLRERKEEREKTKIPLSSAFEQIYWRK
jgi:endogenous inhibitor of DNA gyrase (YacG/DUF329 family)